MSIQPLPPEVIAQIKSSATITTLNGVILDLLKNSLDAGSTKIEVNLDYSRGACTLEDNGLGVLPVEFHEKGGLGKLHHSSKLSSKIPVHGGTGTFLASLSAISYLTITSHHHMYRSHNTLSMYKSAVISRQIPATPQQYLAAFDHGTRVTVRDLFGNMPVRVKQRSLATENSGGFSKDWDILKRIIVNFLLAWFNPVSLVVKNATTNQEIKVRTQSLDQSQMPSSLISKTCSILSQAALMTPQDRLSWVSVGASTSKLEIKGCISLIPCATKRGQFIAFGIQPLLPNEGGSSFYDEINRLFQNSTFGAEEIEELDDVVKPQRASGFQQETKGYTMRNLRGSRKCVDRWPMYYVNIQQTHHSSRARMLEVDEILNEEGNTLSMIMELLQAMVLEFLSRHHFRQRESRIISPADLVSTSTSIENVTPNPIDCDHKGSPGKSKSKEFGHFGANIELPSFRRQPFKPKLPFDGWSRVKSGTTRNSTHKKEARLPRDLGLAIPQALYKSVPEHYDDAQLDMSHTPLLSSTGQVMRNPFEEVTCFPARPTNSIQTASQAPTLNDLVQLCEEGDTIIRWLNPDTRFLTLINQRTCFTVPTQKPSSQRLTTYSTFPSELCGSQDRPSSPWIRSLLETWQNPIFEPSERPISQVLGSSCDKQLPHGNNHHCTKLEIDQIFKEQQSSGLNCRISKGALRYAHVIAQVDQKFILAVLPSESNNLGESFVLNNNRTLILVDQHAASERVLIECLLQDLCSLSSVSNLATPLVFPVSNIEAELFQAKKHFLESWGIGYDIENLRLNGTNENQIRVRTLPNGILERCSRESRLVIDLLRTEIHHPLITTVQPISYPSLSAPEHHDIPTQTSADTDNQDWLIRINSCPQGLLDLLNSRACRSAIMFNDILTKGQCKTLLGQLAQCAFPFNCAHGRPSLVPVIELGSWFEMGLGAEEELGGFGAAMRRWKNG